MILILLFLQVLSHWLALTLLHCNALIKGGGGGGGEGEFPLAFMSRTLDNFHGKQKESTTKSLPYNCINLATRNLSKSPALINIYLHYSVLSLARQTVAQRKAQNTSNTAPSKLFSYRKRYVLSHLVPHILATRNLSKSPALINIYFKFGEADSRAKESSEYHPFKLYVKSTRLNCIVFDLFI